MSDQTKPVARPGETLVHLHFINPDTNDRSTWIGTSAHRALLRDADGRLNLEVMIDVDGQPAPARATEANDTIPDASRLAVLEQRHERIWDIVLELRQKATARGLDPYQDPAARALSAILTGDTGWQITYGTLVETRDDLEAAKARSVALWERTKWEAEEHAHDWEQRPDGSLALVAWDEEQWFDCGPVIQPLTAGPESGPQIPGQTEIPAPAEADEITELRARIGRAHAELRRQHLRADHTLHPDVSGPVMAALEAVETHLTDPEHRLAEPGAAP